VEAQTMKLIGLTIAILAIVSSAAPSAGGDGAPAGVRNCTWCHGASGHGYGNAPELAGQRHQYIENQLLDFHNHVRDNPFSQQYMWGAATNLNAQTARDLAMYFATLPPKSANDGVRELADMGREIYLEGRRFSCRSRPRPAFGATWCMAWRRISRQRSRH
jgi:cytochrome c553